MAGASLIPEIDYSEGLFTPTPSISEDATPVKFAPLNQMVAAYLGYIPGAVIKNYIEGIDGIISSINKRLNVYCNLNSPDESIKKLAQEKIDNFLKFKKECEDLKTKFKEFEKDYYDCFSAYNSVVPAFQASFYIFSECRTAENLQKFKANWNKLKACAEIENFEIIKNKIGEFSTRQNELVNTYLSFKDHDFVRSEKGQDGVSLTEYLDGKHEKNKTFSLKLEEAGRLNGEKKLFDGIKVFETYVATMELSVKIINHLDEVKAQLAQRKDRLLSKGLSRDTAIDTKISAIDTFKEATKGLESEQFNAQFKSAIKNARSKNFDDTSAGSLCQALWVPRDKDKIWYRFLRFFGNLFGMQPSSSAQTLVSKTSSLFAKVTFQPKAEVASTPSASSAA